MVWKWWPKFWDHVFVSCWTLSIWWFFQRDDIHSNILTLQDTDEEFLNGVFSILLSGEFPKMLFNPRFSNIHSSQKEKQLSNLLEASSFVKFQRWLVLRCLMTVQERWGILEWGFGQIGTRSIVKMKFGPNFTDLHFSPKERQLQKRCISFGELYSNLLDDFRGCISFLPASRAENSW